MKEGTGLRFFSELAGPLLPCAVHLEALGLLLFPSAGPRLARESVTFLAKIVSLFVPLRGSSVSLTPCFPGCSSDFTSSFPVGGT